MHKKNPVPTLVAPYSPAQWAFLLPLLSCSLAHIWKVTHFILKLIFKLLFQKRKTSFTVMLGYSATIYSPLWDKLSLHPHSLSDVGAGLLPHKTAQQYYYHIIIIITSLPAIQILPITHILPTNLAISIFSCCAIGVFYFHGSFMQSQMGK